MVRKEIILIGAGGHALSCIDVIEQEGTYHIAGLVGADNQINTEKIGYKVLANDRALQDLSKTYKYAHVTVGQISSPDLRMKIYSQLKELGFDLPVIVSPQAYVSKHACIADGTIVMHGAVVNAGATIGANCIINTCALIEHCAQVADHCHIATRATINGDVKIGSGSFVGSGAVIKQGLEIGERVVIGMGISVRESVQGHQLYVKN